MLAVVSTALAHGDHPATLMISVRDPATGGVVTRKLGVVLTVGRELAIADEPHAAAFTYALERARRRPPGHRASGLDRLRADRPPGLHQRRHLCQTAYTVTDGIRGLSMASGETIQMLPMESGHPRAMLCLWNGVIAGGITTFGTPHDVFLYDGSSGIPLARVSSSDAMLVELGLAASLEAGAGRVLADGDAVELLPGRVALRSKVDPANLDSVAKVGNPKKSGCKRSRSLSDFWQKGFLRIDQS